MRRCLLLLIFVLSLCFASTVEARKLALLVGVDDYENIQSLRCCVNDMKALKEALIKIGFEEDDIQMLVTGDSDKDLPTKKNIEQRIIAIVSKAQPSDMVFLAFSGHSAQEGRNVYFCSRDVKAENIQGTTVSINKVMGVLAKCQAQSKWIVFDVSRNYSIRNGRGLKELPVPPAGVALLQSCSKGEKSLDDSASGNSYFIKNLIAGLSRNADANHDEKLMLKEVCEWTKNQTKTEVLKIEKAFQHPSFSGSADFVLVEGQIPDSSQPVETKIVTVPGDYATIQEAYSNAEDGEVIMIKPGHYELSSTIYANRPVTFRGSSRRAEDVVIDCPDSNAFYINGGAPSFQFLTISSGGVSCSAVSVSGGSPKFLRCVLTARLGSNMYISGEDANPQVDSCILKDCQDGSGALIVNRGRGTFINCDFFENKNAGIVVNDYGNPTVIGCKIHDGKEGGVLIEVDGLGTFKDCEFYRNEYSGIEVRKSGNPTVSNCKFYDGITAGVFVWDKGRGVFNNCEFFRNASPGIIVEDLGNPTVTGCKFHDGKSAGISVSESGLGVFNNCEIYRNTSSGVSVFLSGNPTFNRCKIYEEKNGGVHIYEKGMGTYNNNILLKNSSPGDWYIAPDAGIIKGVGNKPPIGRR